MQGVLAACLCKVCQQPVYAKLTVFNPLNAELNPICHLLALLGVHPILHISRIRVKVHALQWCTITFLLTGYLHRTCTQISQYSGAHVIRHKERIILNLYPFGTGVLHLNFSTPCM